MQAQMAAVYKVGDLYLVHSLMRVPDGFWVAWPPFERISDVAVDPESLAEAAKAALGRSGQLSADLVPADSQSAELFRAAGFKSLKRFVEAATTCTLRRDADGSIIQVRGEVKAARGSHWLPDRDATEVDGSKLTELGEVIKSLLTR